MLFKLRRTNIKDNLLYYIFFIIACSCCVINFMLHKVTDSQINEWVLSLALVICLIFSYGIRRNIRNYSVLIVLIISICRYCISPLSYYITGIAGLQYLRNSHNEYSGTAIFLMIYEMSMVFLAVNFFSEKWLRKSEHKFCSDRQLFKVGNVTYLVMLLGILAMNPQIFVYILNFNFDSSTGVEINSSISGLYVIVYRAAIVVLFCVIIHWTSTRKKSFIISAIVTIISIWISAINLTGRISRTLIIVNGLSLLLVLAKVFPEKRRIIIIVGCVSVAGVAIAGTMFRFSYTSSQGIGMSLNNTFSSVFDYGVMCSYFGGIENVNIALAMSHAYKESINFGTFLNDVFYSFPFLGSRFADFSNITPVYFNHIYHGIVGNTSQIIPYIGQGYVYFGKLMAPIFSVLVVIFSIKCNQKMKLASNELEYFLWCSGVYYGATFAMYNLNIFCMHLTNLMLPIAIAVFLNKRKFVLKK